MPFDTLTPPRKKEVAIGSLSYFKGRYGRNGLKIEEEIHPKISWKPTFYLKPHRNLILATEVDDVLYPEILKIAAHDIRHFDFPIAVYVVCPLEVYLADTRQAKINQLKDHGFGIVTVDQDGNVTMQCSCIPLAQHIPEQELEIELRGLSPKLKVYFKSAHATYQVNEGQGLQEAGQIIEALINSMARESERLNFGTSLLRNRAADTIDALYGLNQLRNYRAALGGARDFLREYRNIASHAPQNARKAMEKIKKCRSGFFDAIRTAKNLQDAMKDRGLRIRIHVT